MPSIIHVLALLATTTAWRCQASVLPRKQAGTQPTVPDYFPPQFIPEYNYSYCSAYTVTLNIPPVAANFPYSPADVYNITGSFFDVQWAMPGLKTTTKGRDNTIGSSRTNEGDKYAAAEILTAYFAGNTSRGFYFQESARADGPTTFMPGYTIEDVRPVFELKPTCDGRGAQFGYYLTFCMSSNASASDQAEVHERFVTGTAASTVKVMQHLGTLLDGKFGGNQSTPFNTTSCEDIKG